MLTIYLLYFFQSFLIGILLEIWFFFIDQDQYCHKFSHQVSESVQILIVHLVNNVISPEDFQSEVQKHIQFPLKQVGLCYKI